MEFPSRVKVPGLSLQKPEGQGRGTLLLFVVAGADEAVGRAAGIDVVSSDLTGGIDALNERALPGGCSRTGNIDGGDG